MAQRSAAARPLENPAGVPWTQHVRRVPYPEGSPRGRGDRLVPRTDVPITGSVLRWAIEESAWTEDELADRLSVDVDELRAWEEGQALPSKTEFNNLVQALKRPSALFFMPEPPTAESITAEFRSAPGLQGHKLTEEESRTLRKAAGVRDVLSWVLKERANRQVQLPHYDRSTPPDTAGSELRSVWGPSLTQQIRWNTPAEGFGVYRELLESIGVFVLQLSITGSKMRGFSLWDDHAPVVVVKSGYNYQARSYTLFHELGHLLRRADSVCHGFVDPDDESDPRIERWCESFAAGFLLPEAPVRRFLTEHWGLHSGRRVHDFDGVMEIAWSLKVSGRAMAIRLQHLGYADRDLYNRVDTHAQVVDIPEGGWARGGRRPRKRIREYGKAAGVLTDAAREGTISRKDSLDYLGVNLAELRELERRLEEE